MEVECPNCSHKFSIKSHAKVCFRFVSITQKEKVRKLIKDLIKNNQRGRTATEIQRDLEDLKGVELSTAKILNLKDWKKQTDGDFLRVILDHFICMGVCKKTKYLKGKGGSRWVYTSIIDTCPYFINGKCCNKSWKMVEEDEVIENV